MQKTFTVGPIEITVRTAQSVRDELNSLLISRRMQSLEPPTASGYYDVFGDLCAHVVKAKGLPFDPVALPLGTAQDAHDAYDCFMAMHKKVKTAWQSACAEVDSEDVDIVTGKAPLAEDADPN